MSWATELILWPSFSSRIIIIQKTLILIEWLYGVKRHFQQYFNYITAASPPIHAFMEFF